MMIQAQPSSLSGLGNLIQAQPSSLSGLGRLFGLGQDESGGFVDNESDDPEGSGLMPSDPVVVSTTTAGFGPGGSAVITPVYTTVDNQSSGTGGSTGASSFPSSTSGSSSGTNWGNVLSSLFGNAASVASTALKSTTQTCQVINGSTVCTTNTTGGAVPTTSATSSLGGSTSLLLIAGAAVIAIAMFAGKR